MERTPKAPRKKKKKEQAVGSSEPSLPTWMGWEASSSARGAPRFPVRASPRVTGRSAQTAQARTPQRLEAVGPSFPGDQAEVPEAAGSGAAAGRGGMEKRGVELEEEGGGDEEEDAARAMEKAEAGAAVSSVPGGLPRCK